MVDTPSDSTGFNSPAPTAPDSAPPSGVMARLRSWFGGNGDASLRESLGDVIEQHQAGRAEFSPEERSMLMNLLQFGELRVEDVMVPRADIVAVDETILIAELLTIFAQAGHSRVPVFRETLDDPVGMVHIKDLMQWMVKTANVKRARKTSDKAKTENGDKDKAAPTLDLQKVKLARTLKSLNIVRPVVFVPPSMSAGDLLVKMQATRIHIGIVVDEYGGTDGLVSIEDLVEEIVGEIVDEHDAEDRPLIERAGEGVYIADARAEIEELEALMDVSLGSDDPEEDVDTLGGLVFALVGRVPVRGELLRHESGIEFEILEADARRIKNLKVHRAQTQPVSKDTS
jgi:CBS domain containing-hemolysin-like protein